MAGRLDVNPTSILQVFVSYHSANLISPARYCGFTMLLSLAYTASVLATSSILILCSNGLALELMHRFLLSLCRPYICQRFHITTTGSGTRNACHASRPFKLRYLVATLTDRPAMTNVILCCC